MIPFDLLSEFSTAKARGETGVYIEFFWTLGTIFVALIAWGSLEKVGWQFVTVMCQSSLSLLYSKVGCILGSRVNRHSIDCPFPLPSSHSPPTHPYGRRAARHHLGTHGQVLARIPAVAAG